MPMVKVGFWLSVDTDKLQYSIAYRIQQVIQLSLTEVEVGTCG